MPEQLPYGIRPTNKEDWTVNFEGVDDDTGSLIDFTGATINVQINDKNRCSVATASTSDVITISTTTVTIPFTYSAHLSNLCQGEYTLCGYFTLNGVRRQFLNHTFNMDDGGVDA